MKNSIAFTLLLSMAVPTLCFAQEGSFPQQQAPFKLVDSNRIQILDLKAKLSHNPATGAPDGVYSSSGTKYALPACGGGGGHCVDHQYGQWPSSYSCLVWDGGNGWIYCGCWHGDAGVGCTFQH